MTDKNQDNRVSQPPFPLEIRKGTAFPLTKRLKVARADVPRFCEALSDVISARGLCTQYEPHYRHNMCLCSYSWHLRFRDKEHGLLVTIWAPIGSMPLQEFEVYVTAGQHLKKEEILTLSKEDYIRVLRSLQEVLDATEAILAGRCPKRFIAWFLKGVFYADQACIVNEHGILPSRTLGDSVITPVIITISAYNDTLAKGRTEKTLFIIRNLLELLSHNTIEIMQTKTTNGSDPCAFRAFPSIEEVYSIIGETKGLTPGNRKTRFCVNTLGEAILRLGTGDYLEQHPPMANALYAYADAMHVSCISLTLAGIAYFAATASLVPDHRCDGEVTCSTCGRLKLRHKLEGEAVAVVRFLDEHIFAGREWAKDLTQKYLQLFHREQRSAFVHGARVVFPKESDRSYTGPLAPSEHSPIHPEVKRIEILHTVRDITRLVILYLLSQADPAFSDLYNKARDSFKPVTNMVLSSYRVGPTPIHLGIPRPVRFSPGDS